MRPYPPAGNLNAPRTWESYFYWQWSSSRIAPAPWRK